MGASSFRIEPEDGGTVFLQNVGIHLEDYTVLQDAHYLLLFELARVVIILGFGFDMILTTLCVYIILVVPSGAVDGDMQAI
jgi:hypothetical protein